MKQMEMSGKGWKISERSTATQVQTRRAAHTLEVDMATRHKSHSESGHADHCATSTR